MKYKSKFISPAVFKKSMSRLILLLAFTHFAVSTFSQTLDTFLKRAYSNNPELKALEMEYKGEVQKSEQVAYLPDPLVGVGFPMLRPETRLGSQVFSISASQMFPWFGTLKTKKDIVFTMSKAKYESINAAKLNIDFQIKTAYFKLYLLQGKQNLIKKNIRIFETLENVANVMVESGKSIASDVLLIRMKIAELKNNILILDEEKKKYYATINNLTYSNPDENIAIDSVDINLADLNYNFDSLREKIQKLHPLIRQIDFQIEKSKQEIELNSYSSRPSFGLGFDYSIVNPRTDATPANNGRDILIPKIMFTLPIYRKKYEAKDEEEKIHQKAFEYRKENIVNNMITDIRIYESDYEDSKLKFQLAKSQIELSKSAYNILLTEYSSSGNRFDDLIKLESEINKLELDQWDAIIQSHLTKFKIEKLVSY